MAWLLTRIDFNKVLVRWRDVNWLMIALLLPTLSLLNTSVRAGRIRFILHAQGIEFPYRWLWLLQLRGSFILSFIPGKFSGDVYRSYAIGRSADRPLDSVTSVLLERLIGLGTLIIVSFGSLVLGVYVFELTSYSSILPAATLLAVVVFIGALTAFLILRRRTLHGWKLPIPFWNRLLQLSEQLHKLVANDRMLGVLALLSITLQFIVILWYFVIARAMEINISLIMLMISVPIVELLVTVPISIGGVGVRDSAMVFLLLPFGLSAEDAVSLSLLAGFTATLAGVLAGLSFFVTMPKEIGIQHQQAKLDHVVDQA